MAIWLLRANERTERVLRRLQQEWEEVRQLENVRDTVGAPSLHAMEGAIGVAFCDGR